MVRTIELQRDLMLAHAGAAAAVGRAAPPWQLALGRMTAAFLIYQYHLHTHHGRAMARVDGAFALAHPLTSSSSRAQQLTRLFI